MLKLLITLTLFFSFLNASPVKFTVTPIAEITDPEYCYQRALSQLEYILGIPNSYCQPNPYVFPSSWDIRVDICVGPTFEWYEHVNIEDQGTVDLTKRAWTFNYVKCSTIDLTKDLDGVEVVYVDGIPYDKSDVENASHFDPYSNLLKCKPTYLQINNMSCIKPDYEERNLADAILKRDKIAKENNLTNVSGIDANNITYNDNGSIQSFSFTATNPEGGIESIYTEFKETDPVFTVEDDGTIKESTYIPPFVIPGDGGETGTTPGTGTGEGGETGTTPGTGTGDGGETGTNPGTGTGDGGNTGGTGGSISNPDGSSAGTNLDEAINNHLFDINNSLNNVETYLNPDLTNPTLDNPLEESDTYYDDYVIPQISELVTNLTNDFNNLKNTYVEKIDYIKENGFEFDYKSKVYETCPMNFKLNPFKDSENKDIKDEELELNIDICSLMANAKLPDSETSMLEIFYTIFYTFFYTVILLGIFKFSTLIFRSF
ncbi:hypothetical protein [Aliarcobacter cryaerophilus]|uniref:hypothetical protein n=1 Tax=Aliarcobacter cryaerophilus TaxID=28198 RepID=UPI000EB1B03D|nr:hypothetical protein [Aliarcobacter cryaerophilus]AYJ78182.1 hypothetical protein ACRYD_1035 [Aliarcobacter cryaerophilus D2610]